MKSFLIACSVVALSLSLGACASVDENEIMLSQKAANVEVYRTKTPKCEYKEEAFFVTPAMPNKKNQAMNDAIVYAKREAAKINADFVIVTTTYVTEDSMRIEAVAGRCMSK